MAIQPFNFEEQTITSSGMAAVFRALLTDGVLTGCNFSYSGNNFTISAGNIIIGGHVFGLSSTQTISVTGASGTASIVCKLDLGQTSSESTFNQISFRAENGAYTPEQGDLDIGVDNVYEIVLAIVTLSGSGITGITSRLPSAHRATYVQSNEPDNAKPGDIWLVMPEG